MEKIAVLLADDHAIIRDGLKQQILADTEDLVVAGEGSQWAGGHAEGPRARMGVLARHFHAGRRGLKLLHMPGEETPVAELPILVLSMHHEEHARFVGAPQGRRAWLPDQGERQRTAGDGDPARRQGRRSLAIKVAESG